MFKKATKQQAKLKLSITGPSGSGKTYSALRLAKGLTTGGRVAFIDTENQSASLYSGRFDFDVAPIAPPFTDDKFIEAIRSAEGAKYDVLIIDSSSHFWEGILEYKLKLDTRGGNSYTNWADAGRKFKGILDAVLQSDLHVICCLRSKMDYVLETNAQGKSAPKKVGLAPVMRDGIEYEFTAVFDVDMAHNCQTSKDRTGLFGTNIFQITEDTGSRLLTWMADGAAVVAVARPQDKVSRLAVAFAGHEDVVLTYLMSIKWIPAGGGFIDVSDENAEKALARPSALITKATGTELARLLQPKDLLFPQPTSYPK